VKLARARIRIVPKRLGDGFEKFFFAKLRIEWLPRCAAFVGIAALWENWKTPRTARIHDRMPAIPRGHLTMSGGSALTPIRTTSLTPFPDDLMIMWPISTRVNSPRNER
jgi:putative SOS response-associated peptidase YedK